MSGPARTAEAGPPGSTPANGVRLDLDRLKSAPASGSYLVMSHFGYDFRTSKDAEYAENTAWSTRPRGSHSPAATEPVTPRWPAGPDDARYPRACWWQELRVRSVCSRISRVARSSSPPAMAAIIPRCSVQERRPRCRATGV